MTSHESVTNSDTASEDHGLGFLVKTRGVWDWGALLGIGIQEAMIDCCMGGILEASWIGGYILYLLAKDNLEMCQACGLGGCLDC